jgi:Sulfotransferase family
MTESTDRDVAARGAAPAAHMPDFFVVGHPKCGTTALYEMLRQHPQIYMPDVKEPSFFVPETRARAGNSKHPDTLESYLALFAAARPGQRVGEASPSYLWSSTAARRIAQARPDARIIAILREPASYLRSLHLQFLRTNVESEKDLRTALRLEERRREGDALPRNSTRPRWLLYSEQVRYVDQLRRYHEMFSRQQMLVLIYEEYRADSAGTLRQVLRFLDVDETFSIDAVEANPATRIRSPRLEEIVRSLYLGRSRTSRTLKAAIEALTPRRLRREVLALQRRAQRARPRSPDEQLMLELRRRYKGEVVALSEYLNRDLVTLWGYDSLG